MIEFFLKLFDTTDFPPRWHCGNWSEGLGWLHIISDTTIFLAYTTIPLTLIYFLFKRKDIPFLPIFWLFAVFILLCGFGHLVEAIIFWNPIYRFAGLEKASTALVSVMTAIALVRVIPLAMDLPDAHAQRRMQGMVESAPSAWLSINAKEEIEHVNQTAIDLFGYSKDELEGRQVKELFDDMPFDVISHLAYSGLGESTQVLNERNGIHGVRKDKTRFPCAISLSSIKFKGKYTLLLAISDISEHVSAIEKYSIELEQKNTELEVSNEDLKAFTYIASHDLKSPLRAIDNLSSWVIEDAYESLPGESQRHLRQLKNRIHRMERFLDELLEYSKIGRIESKNVSVDVNVLVQDLKDLLDFPSDCVLDVDNCLPSFVTDKTTLELVFRNLISNAIKHRNMHKSLNIQISHRETDKYYEFSVKDNGPGIPAKYSDRIFLVFQTLASRDEVEGSGLGLAMVKKAVVAQGGDIKVHSILGEGAQFVFTWPKENNSTKECNEKSQFSIN